jgi:hypothetical protein
VALAPGVDAIIALVRPLAGLVGSTHLMGEPVITVDGDRAHTVASAIACLAGGQGTGPEPARQQGVAGGDPTLGVRIRGLVYEDDWVLVDGEWKIATRVHRARWMTEGPLLTNAP